jgi:CheY-like chemotaxis protein
VRKVLKVSTVMEVIPKNMSAAKILLVDDNIADVKLLRLALDAQEGAYELQVIPTGEDALRFVQTHQTSMHADPCLIILDLHMPRHDGLDILVELKGSADLANVSVVVLSGAASPSEKRRIAELGASYIQKPSDLSEYMQLGSKIMDICSSGTMAAVV